MRRFTTMPRGGHFAALEQPDLLVEDIRALLKAGETNLICSFFFRR